MPESDLNRIKRIEEYLGNELSETEKAAFEQEMKEDEALAKEVRMHRDIHHSIEANGNKKLRKELDQYYYENKRKKKRIFSLRVWEFAAVAAATVLLLTFIIHKYQVQQLQKEISAVSKTDSLLPEKAGKIEAPQYAAKKYFPQFITYKLTKDTLYLEGSNIDKNEIDLFYFEGEKFMKYQDYQFLLKHKVGSDTLKLLPIELKSLVPEKADSVGEFTLHLKDIRTNEQSDFRVPFHYIEGQ